LPLTRPAEMLYTAESINPRTYRLLLMVGAIALFCTLCIVLLRSGFLQITVSAAALLLGVWSMGLLGLLLVGDNEGLLRSRSLTFIKAVWCNLGIIITALLVPHPIRLLLLVAPLFGVLFTALHLDRSQMLVVSAVTWLSYLAGVGLLLYFGVADIQTELLIGLAFSCMLAIMVVMASEVTALKTAFERRRDSLNSAMEQLAELAMRDELTGLYNRRYIMDVLERQKALADRGHLGFTVCYCDLDHFKRINDQYGHQTGDQALREFAEVARSVVRSVDYVARLGGEEFLLLLSGADAEKAHSVTRRLCERSRSLAVIADDPDFRLTASVGIASYRPGERVEDVIQRADQALYVAKAAGRDRIVIGE
jgi:diguanylate cyclase (GGDEF)-like protein